MPSPGASILSLFFASCPSDVPRFVSSIVINTIEGAPWRRLADFGDDIGQESLKDRPLFAGQNVSTTVICESFVVGVETTIHHRCQASINRGSTPPWRMSMNGVAGNQFISMGAPATGDASSDVADGGSSQVSAVAAAFPERLFALFAGKAQYGQSTEFQSSDIAESGHSGFSISGSVKGRSRVLPRGRPAHFTTKTWVLQ
jgi:hypothetical protein